MQIMPLLGAALSWKENLRAIVFIFGYAEISAEEPTVPVVHLPDQWSKPQADMCGHE